MFRVISWRRWPALLMALLLICGVAEAVWPSSTVAVDTAATEGVALPVVMYHGILPQTDRQGRYVISPALFEQDLAYIRQAGYTTVTVADLLSYVDEGTPLPEKPIMLTFDDGYYNNYRYAYPLLKQYGMRAVISPVVAWSQWYSDHPEETDREIYSHITWEQIREMADSGVIEIQNHSYDLHHNEKNERQGASKLAGETAEAYQAMLRDDLVTAQRLLTEKTGVTPTAFTYPYGAMSAEAQAVLEEMGFRASFSCESRVNVITKSLQSLWKLGRYLRTNEGKSEAFFSKLFRAAEAAR